MIATLLALAAVAAPPPDTARHANGVDYRIEARLDESTSVLHGRARLRYTNRSARALDTIYVHQHLNAFRPNSAWARRELQFGNRRFTDLGPDDHAFERFRQVTVDGAAVRPVYPGAPDSTVAAIPLPRPLAPGATATVVMDWDARLSTLPRRQGRRGRQHDFAQWYPRVAVHEPAGWAPQPLLPQGEFSGEFATYDVTLDLAADQVVGATGVAVEGDPGYPVTAFERDFYPRRDAEALGFLTGGATAGRKRVRFHADSVHHFAWSTSPDFRHEGVERMSLQEGGEVRGLPSIHVLFLPGDTAWDDGVVARRTYDALAWMQGKFGPYPWPQLTNLHRLESGGTEFPMVVMNGSSSEALIVHEVAHQWLHGILANIEWREGWLDEGFTSFVTSWYFEEKGQTDVWTRDMQGLARFLSVDSVAAQPVGWPGERYTSPNVYSAMTYTKGSAVFRMLREYLGAETFGRVLREFYARHRLSRVYGADFQRVAEEVSGQDLDWFFGQWIERGDRLDYAVANVASRPEGGRWVTEAEVVRTGEAWMPVEVRVGDQVQRLAGRDARQRVRVVTAAKPAEVVVDPRMVNIDIDWSNNRAPVP